jgi:hypothetical protein
MSVVIEKGAIRSQIRGIENLPIIIALYEVIDDRKHSNSKKVFIDIDLHNRTCMIGYSEEATKDNIDNMVKWYNTNKEQINANNIASKGIGLKFFEFRALGTWKHITKCFDKKMYYTSEINTFDIWNAEVNDEISSIIFSEILHRGTSFCKEEDELSLSIENILNNTDNKYPFQPKTIFRCNNLKNINLLDEYKDEKGNFDFDDIIKRLKIKYYNEISKGFELYIKLPGYTEFEIIENTNIDVIGFTNNKKNELKIEIFINSNFYYGYFFKIGENAYEFRKNGNSVIRQKINNINNISSSPDFSLVQYNINDMSKEEKQKSIFGKSEEACAGLFIEIGGTFINDQPVEWQIIKRNLAGSKNFRAVLRCLSPESKHHLKLSGLKAQFNLATMNNLHNCIKCLTDVYKIYNKNMSINSDDYVLIKTTASKSDIDKQIEGYLYIIELGKNFFKFGFSSNQQRIFDYITEKYSSYNIKDFPEIEFHINPYCRYLSIKKIKNIKLLEEKIKSLIVESTICQTYDCSNGIDIREYFSCNYFNDLFSLIIDEINKHK